VGRAAGQVAGLGRGGADKREEIGQGPGIGRVGPPGAVERGPGGDPENEPDPALDLLGLDRPLMLAELDRPVLRERLEVNGAPAIGADRAAQLVDVRHGVK
jgi:hypothetical protein